LRSITPITLRGRHIHLEPLEDHHLDALVAASAADPSIYQWSPVPQGREEAADYIATALRWHRAGTALPFAIIRADDGAFLGSTRFWNIEYWAWPIGHKRHGRNLPDACEIGHTWLARSAVRTAANSESKFLMLMYAFETWGVLRVCLHTDARNIRSQKAIERIGGRREGILRAHRLASDFTPRDSVRYSIIASEWPGVKERLSRLLLQPVKR
jgi:RimJ/RimL family protein N-acetyltransferase